MDFKNALLSIAEFLRSEEVPFAITGGFALQAYGRARATFDLDLVVPRPAQATIVAFMEARGYETLHVSEGYSNHLHPGSALGRVDFVYVGEDTARRVFGEARPQFRFGDETYPVVRPEHLAAMKVFALKNDPSRRLQELTDIRFLLELPGVDREAIRKEFLRHGLESDADEVFRGL
jgi:hypothetical protein